MTDGKTIFSIVINNENQIISNIDLSSIIDEEDALRFVHSILDEYKQEVLEKIREVKTAVEEDELDSQW